MVDRRCCCRRGCTICEDAFNRPDSTDIGTVLIEQHGDSEIRSNRLWMPGGLTPHATVRTACQHPALATSGIVYATAINTVLGGIYRVLINYNPTTGEGHYLEMEQGANTRTYRLDTGSSKTSLPGSPPGDDVDLVTCYTGRENGMLSCFEPGGEVWDQADPVEGGYYAGLQNPGPVNIRFDNFKFEEHYVTNALCEDCACTCNYHMPHHDDLVAVVTADGCAAPIDGLEVPLPIELEEATHPHQLTWAGSAYNPGCDVCAMLRLWCAFGDERDPDSYDINDGWYLTFENVVDYPQIPECEEGGLPMYGAHHDLVLHPNPDLSTCSPFSLVFGPVNAQSGDWQTLLGAFANLWACCGPEDNGNYWITITEVP